PHRVLQVFPTRRSSDLFLARMKFSIGQNSNQDLDGLIITKGSLHRSLLLLHISWVDGGREITPLISSTEAGQYFVTQRASTRGQDRKSTRLNSSHVKIS